MAAALNELEGFTDCIERGDAEGAEQFRAQADALETQADALEQAQREAQNAAQDAVVLEEKHEPVFDEAGEVNEDAFTKVVDQIEEDVCRAGGAPAQIQR